MDPSSRSSSSWISFIASFLLIIRHPSFKTVWICPLTGCTTTSSSAVHWSEHPNLFTRCQMNTIGSTPSVPTITFPGLMWSSAHWPPAKLIFTRVWFVRSSRCRGGRRQCVAPEYNKPISSLHGWTLANLKTLIVPPFSSSNCLCRFLIFASPSSLDPLFSAAPGIDFNILEASSSSSFMSSPWPSAARVDWVSSFSPLPFLLSSFGLSALDIIGGEGDDPPSFTGHLLLKCFVKPRAQQRFKSSFWCENRQPLPLRHPSGAFLPESPHPFLLRTSSSWGVCKAADFFEETCSSFLNSSQILPTVLSRSSISDFYPLRGNSVNHQSCPREVDAKQGRITVDHLSRQSIQPTKQHWGILQNQAHVNGRFLPPKPLSQSCNHISYCVGFSWDLQRRQYCSFFLALGW